MAQTKENFDKEINEEKKSETQTESSQSDSTEVHDNDPLSSTSTSNKTDDSKNDEMTNDLDKQTNSPNTMNELSDNQSSSDFSVNLNDNKQADVSIISNEDRGDGQPNPIVSNESINDEKNKSSNTSNTSNDNKQINSPTVSTNSEDKQAASSIPDDDESNNDKQNKQNSSSNISTINISTNSNEDEKTNTPTTLTNYDEQTNPTIPNESHDNSNTTINKPEFQAKKEPSQFTDTKDLSKHNSSEDNINLKEQNQAASLHDNKDSSKHNYTPNESDADLDGEYEILKMTKSILEHNSGEVNIDSHNEKQNLGEKLNNETEAEPTKPADMNGYKDEVIGGNPPKIHSSNIFDTSKNETIAEPNMPENSINTSDYNNEVESNHNLTPNNDGDDSVDDDDDNDDDDDEEEDEEEEDEDNGDNLHNGSEYTKEKGDDETKLEPNQPTIADDVHFNKFETDFSTQNYTSNTSNVLDSNSNEVRRRPNQQHQESSSSSKNITPLKNPNIKVVKKADTENPVTLNKIVKNVFFSILLFGLIYFAYDIYNLSQKPSPFRKIADVTDKIFEEINSVEFPAVSTISDRSVACRSAANMVERNDPFKSYGARIAAGLRDIGNIILKAGQSLQSTYSKGSSLQTSFDTEIGTILHRLNSNSNYVRQEDVKFFHDRLDKLVKKIKGLKSLVEKSHDILSDAEKTRLDINDDIEKGLRESEKYNNNEKYSATIIRAKKDLVNVDNILFELHINIGNLKKLREILNYYENELMEVSEELGELGVKGFKVSKSDIKHLRRAVDDSKALHHNFNKLAQA